MKRICDSLRELKGRKAVYEKIMVICEKFHYLIPLMPPFEFQEGSSRNQCESQKSQNLPMLVDSSGHRAVSDPYTQCNMYDRLINENSWQEETMTF